MRWLAVPVMLVCWWNRSVPVDGLLQDSERCNLITAPYSDPPCSIGIGFKGPLPQWLQSEDIAQAIMGLTYPELKETALQQICPCRTLGLSPLPTCPANLHAAFERLKQLCPYPVEFLNFPYSPALPATP